MKRNILCLWSGCLVLAGVLMARPDSAKPKKQPSPNLVVILADQWYGEAIGFLGKEPVLTPHIDSLAKSSYVMKQMVGNFPLCSPSRAMFFTGQYPLKNGVYSNVNSASHGAHIELRKESVCWSDVLKSRGYFNGYIGKWHLDSPDSPYVDTYNNKGKVAWNEWTPPDRRHGFDYWYAYGTYDRHDDPMYWDTQASRDGFHYVHQWGPIHEADKAIAFLKNANGQIRPAGRPFSLMVSFNPPHSNYATVPQKYLDLYKNVPVDALARDPDVTRGTDKWGAFYRENIKYYFAAISGIDDQVGRILNALKEEGLDQHTIVLVIADHGNCLGKHDEESKNNYYDESLRIPFILYWKGHIVPKMDDSLPGSMPDVYPTLMELMGLKRAVPAGVDGISYAPYILQGGRLPAREQFILGGIPSAQVRIFSGFRGIRTPAYKLVYQKQGAKVQGYLYDLSRDPFELHNLYGAHRRAVIRDLRQRLQHWLDKTRDAFILPDEL